MKLTRSCRFLSVSLLIAALTLLSACIIKPRSSSDLAPAMQKKLYLQFDPLNSNFEAALSSMLQAFGIKLVAKPNDAPLTLHITKFNLSNNAPTITVGNQATTVSYTLSFNYVITTAKGKVAFGPSGASATQSITTNPNQAYISVPDTLKEDLIQRALNTFFYTITSNDSIKQIQNTVYPTLKTGQHANKN